MEDRGESSPRAAHAAALDTKANDYDVNRGDVALHTARGRRLSKGSLSYLWRPVAAAWREKTGHPLDLYELRHACATLLLERGLSPADVALQLGHSDGGRLVMQLYGHPDDDRARDRLKMAFATDAGSEREAPVRRMGSEGVAGRSPK